MLCWFSLAETEVTNPANHGDRGMMPGPIVAMNGPFEDDNAVDAVGSQCGWMKLNDQSQTGKSLNTDSHHHQDVTIRNHVDHVDVTIRILNF